MSFVLLNPWMLAAATAAAVPVWLHLRAHRARRRVLFPAAAILPEAQTARAARRRRLRELLHLIVRVALLALLALLFARPAVRTWTEGPSGEPVALALVLDDSPSMATRARGQTRLTRARVSALDLLDALPEGSLAVVALASGAIEGPTSNRARLRAFIENTEISFRTPSLAHALRRACGRLEDASVPDKRVVALSDFGAGAWPRSAGPPENIAGLPVTLVNVGGESADDWLVRAVEVEPARLWQGLPARARVRVERPGPTATRASAQAPPSEAAVSLHMNDDLVGRRSVRLAPGESAEAEFLLAPRSAGALALEARVEVDDANALDNVRTAAFWVNAPVETLLVAPPGRGAYARDALAPFPGAERARCRVRTIAPAELSRTSFDGVELIVLAHVGLGPASAQRLARFLDGGGGLLIFLDPAGTTDKETARLAGIRPLGARNDAASLAPGVSALGRRCARAFGGTLPEGRVRRWRPLAARQDARAKVAFTLRGKPAALERPLGRGRVLTFGFAPEPESAPLVADAPDLFVVLMHESAAHLARVAPPPASVRPAEPVAVALHGRERGASAALVTPHGRHDLSVDHARLLAFLTAPATPGIAWIEIQRNGETLRRCALAVAPPAGEFAAGHGPPERAPLVAAEAARSALAGEALRERTSALGALLLALLALEALQATRRARDEAAAAIREAVHGE